MAVEVGDGWFHSLRGVGREAMVGGRMGIVFGGWEGCVCVCL